MNTASYTHAVDMVMKHMPDPRKRDRYTAVLEAIQADFQAFGEKLEYTDVKVSTIESRLERIAADLEYIKLEMVDPRS